MDFETNPLVNAPLALDGRAVLHAAARVRQNPHGPEDVLAGRFGGDNRRSVVSLSGADRERGMDAGIGVVRVSGVLWHRGWWHDYGDILGAIQKLHADPQIKAIMLEIDSPGGHANGVFDVADQIAALRGDKPIWAVANERMTSAAYAIGAAADRVIAPQTADIGSIGCAMVHFSFDEWNKNAGIAVTPVFAGARKVDGHPEIPLSEEALAGFKAEIDTFYGIFTDLVARHRGLDETKVQATQSRVFLGEQALSEGLIDAVMPVADAYRALADEIKPKSPALPFMAAQPQGPMRVATKEKPVSDFTKALADARKAAKDGTSISEAEKAAAYDRIVDLAEAENITASAPDDNAVSQDRTRIAAILGHDEAKGREALARELAFSGASVEAAEKMLKVAPKQAASGLLAELGSDPGPDVPGDATATLPKGGAAIDVSAIYARANGHTN